MSSYSYNEVNKRKDKSGKDFKTKILAGKVVRQIRTFVKQLRELFELG